MKLPNFVLKFFKNFKQNPKNIGYKRQNQIKTHFSMPKWGKGTLPPQILEKKKPFFKKISPLIPRIRLQKNKRKIFTLYFFQCRHWQGNSVKYFCVARAEEFFRSKNTVLRVFSHFFFPERSTLFGVGLFF